MGLFDINKFNDETVTSDLTSIILDFLDYFDGDGARLADVVDRAVASWTPFEQPEETDEVKVMVFDDQFDGIQ